MSSKKQAEDLDFDKLSQLEDRIIELEQKLNSERKLNEEKTAMMRKTIAETEDLAKHLQNTTLALIQERQIANARAEKEKLVNKWIEKINSSFDLNSLLKHATSELGRFFKSDRCGIVLIEGGHLLAHYETSTKDFNRDDMIQNLDVDEFRSNKHFRKIFKTKSRIVLDEISEEGILLDGVKTFVGFFISIKKEAFDGFDRYHDTELEISANEIVGAFYFQQCSNKKSWQDKDLDLIQSIITPLSTAIEKTLLYRDARKRTEYAELLNSLTTQIRSSLNLSEILARTVNELGLAIKASRCFLYFDGYISDEYCEAGVHSIADTTRFLILDKFREDQSFQVISVDNLLSEENFSRLTAEEQEELLASKAVSALACPLHFQGIMQGWIVFHSYRRRQWTRDEKNFIEAAGSQVIVAMTQSRMYEKLNSYQEKLSRELKQAARVQTSLIGGDVFDVNIETSVFYKAHSNVSGDFYWVAELAPDKIGVLIGDVSGKGPAAALLTGYLLGEFNSAIANSALAWFPDKMISFLCQSILYQNSSSDFYATAWYGVMDLYKGKLRYTNAGHLNPYIIQNDTVYKLDGDKDSGVPLGLINPKEIEEAYEAREIDFRRGDKMVLFTDGVLDQKMPDGSFVPKDWIYKILQNVKDRDVKDITYELNEKLNALSGTSPLTDDRLMISLEQVYFDIYDFSADDPKATSELLDKIVRDCLEQDMPANKQLNLRLGITEALTNAVRYGLKRNPYGKIRIGYCVKKGAFKMTIIDPGPGFNWQVYNYTFIDEVRFDNEGGRGIPLLLEIFDKVTWNFMGNHLGLFYYW